MAEEVSLGLVEEEQASQPQETNSEAGDEHAPEASLPDVAHGPALEGAGPAVQRRPMLRTNVAELDEGIAPLARSLAPRKPRSER